MSRLSVLSAGLFPARRTGYYYSPSIVVAGAASPTLNRLYAVPWWDPRPTAYDRLCCEVTTGTATAICRLGAYVDDDGTPGALLFEAATTVDASTTGVKELTIARTLSGVVWLAIVAQTAAPALRFANNLSPVVVGVPAVPTTASVGGLFADGVTGALPATFPATGGNPGSLPRLHLRAV